MTGKQEITTAGNLIFTPWTCEYCQMDSGGNHAYNCPNNNIIDERYYDDYPKSRATKTTIGKVVYF